MDLVLSALQQPDASDADSRGWVSIGKDIPDLMRKEHVAKVVTNPVEALLGGSNDRLRACSSVVRDRRRGGYQPQRSSSRRAGMVTASARQ